MTKITRKNHTVDASGEIFGRVASNCALLLRGKYKVNFLPNIDNGDFVVVKNLKEIKFSGKKTEQKIYYRHSGYPGGIKSIVLGKFFTKRPEEVFKKAVFGMLPKNKLRANMIKRLKIEI